MIEVSKLSLFRMWTNGYFLPAQREPLVPAAWIAAGRGTSIFIKLSSVIHGCLPPELTHNSRPINLPWGQAANRSFQDMLPCRWPSRNCICRVQLLCPAVPL